MIFSKSSIYLYWDTTIVQPLTYFEMVIFVPDSAMIRFRVLPPFPVQRKISHDTVMTQWWRMHARTRSDFGHPDFSLTNNLSQPQLCVCTRLHYCTVFLWRLESIMKQFVLITSHNLSHPPTN